MKPDLSKLRDHSRTAQEAEPFIPPYIAHFQRGAKHLYYVAAAHQFGVHSSTAKTVAEAFNMANPQLIVLEGLPTDAGPSPAFYVAYTEQHAAEGFAYDGEIAYAAHLAHTRGVPFIGGEPRDRAIYHAMNNVGFATKDMMAFELLRSISIWRQRGTLDEADFSRQATEYLRDHAWFDVPDEERLTYSEFEPWYRMHRDLGKPFLQVESGDLAPVRLGNYFERLSYELNAVRDRNAVQTIADGLSAHDRVLVIYGGSHLVIARLVFEDMLGKAEHSKPFSDP